jgi:hypothetical protein
VTASRLRGILLDVNVGGKFTRLIQRNFAGGVWLGLWQDLALAVLTLHALDLPDNSSDELVWQTCQAEGLVLLTCNRNHEGADSLEATIRRHNQSHSLPVLTISDSHRFGNDSAYDACLAQDLLAYLIDIDRVRGTGRLYVPID